MYEMIPQELKALPNWVCWQSEPDEKAHSGISKKPIDPKTGKLAKSNDPSTWADYDTALSASGKFSGLGFMFSGSGFFGVDLDDMPQDIEDYKNGGEKNIVYEFVNTLQSYAEYSQSGQGIHIICKGKLPPNGRRRRHPFGGFEMYDTGRFFIMTGDICAEFAEIAECTEAIKPLHEKYIGAGCEPVPKRQTAAPELSCASDIIRAAATSKSGGRFVALQGGDISGYASHSEADMAFCSMLAFWTGCNAEMMDSIFRSSGLMRDKWDRRQSGSTYGALTIQKAIASCTQTYKAKTQQPSFTASFKAPAAAEEEGDEKPRLYSFDDMGNAERFCDLFGDSIRYSYTDKRWYWYDGRRWLVDNNGTSERLADKSALAMRAEAKLYAEQDEAEGTELLKAFEKHCKLSRSNKSKRAMLAEVQHHVPIQPSQTDRHKLLLNTPSGVIDLKTGKTYPHSGELYFTKLTGAEYSVTNDCPRWSSFLDEIFGGDKDLIRYVQKAVGYSLTGSTAEQCAFFLFGNGRNGKSTFLEVIRSVFGDYSANIQPETIMVRSAAATAINSDIARLKGARLVTSVEPNEGVRINEGLLKQLTGDDVVTARKLYGDEFEFKPEFKLWMATNHKPIIRGTDTGIWRRIHLIPFTAIIPEERVDKALKHKLTRELSGIFRWAVQGCLLWQQEGLKMPARVLESVREYRREMDVISAFVEDRCTVGKGCSVQASVLYAAYLSWADKGNEYKMSATKFGAEMSKRFERVKGMKSNYYNGLKLDEMI